MNFLTITLISLVFSFIQFDVPLSTNQSTVNSETRRIAQIRQINNFNLRTNNILSIPNSQKPTPTPAISEQTLSPQGVFKALNSYRTKNGMHTLAWDSKLAEYAQQRSDHFKNIGNLDLHAGFKQLTSQESGFYLLGYRQLGENSSSGFLGSPTKLIEEIYAESIKHQQNQLSRDWSSVGIGVTNGYTNLVFGGSRFK